MGVSHVLMILASLLIPAVVVIVVGKLGKKYGWAFTRRVERSPMLTTLVFSAACSTTLIALAVTRPTAAGGAPTVREEAEEGPAEIVGIGRIFVYALEDWGEDSRRENVGTQFSRAVQDELVANGWPAKKGVEAQLPLDLFQTDTAVAGDVLTAYRYNAPCVCIFGTISKKRDGGIEARVRVCEVTAAINSVELIEATVSFPYSPSTLKASARDLADRIIEEALAGRE